MAVRQEDLSNSGDPTPQLIEDFLTVFGDKNLDFFKVVILPIAMKELKDDVSAYGEIVSKLIAYADRSIERGMRHSFLVDNFTEETFALAAQFDVLRQPDYRVFNDDAFHICKKQELKPIMREIVPKYLQDKREYSEAKAYDPGFSYDYRFTFAAGNPDQIAMFLCDQAMAQETGSGSLTGIAKEDNQLLSQNWAIVTARVDKLPSESSGTVHAPYLVVNYAAQPEENLILYSSRNKVTLRGEPHNFPVAILRNSQMASLCAEGRQFYQWQKERGFGHTLDRFANIEQAANVYAQVRRQALMIKLALLH